MTKTDLQGNEIKPQRFTADIKFENIYRYYKVGSYTYFDRIKHRQLGDVFPDDKFLKLKKKYYE